MFKWKQEQNNTTHHIAFHEIKRLNGEWRTRENQHWTRSYQYSNNDHSALNFVDSVHWYVLQSKTFLLVFIVK
jgi:hypothetical protein